MTTFPAIRASVSLSAAMRCTDCNARIAQFKRMFARDLEVGSSASVPICGQCFDREMTRREAAARAGGAPGTP